jgi:hypothetical protein
MKARRDAFAPMTEPEFSSALATLVDGGFEPADFLLEERCSNFRMPGGVVRISKLVSVKRLATGFQRQYTSGPGSGWPYEFGRDLGALTFGARNGPSTRDSG